MTATSNRKPAWFFYLGWVASSVISIPIYLLLRPYFPRMGWWTAATVVSWLLPFVLQGLIFASGFPALDISSMWSLAFSVVASGSLFGLAQWLILRRRERRASWWILATVFGWGVPILISGGTISTWPDVCAVALVPPSAASIAWWLLLDRGLGRPVA